MWVLSIRRPPESDLLLMEARLQHSNGRDDPRLSRAPAHIECLPVMLSADNHPSLVALGTAQEKKLNDTLCIDCH